MTKRTATTPRTIKDLKPDGNNANRGTAKGRELIHGSLARYGFGRSVLIDRNGTVIAGNKTVEEAQRLGADQIIVVPSDGKKLIVVQRTDLDLAKDKNAKELALADNRSAELDLEWDGEAIARMDADLAQFFDSEELALLLPAEEIDFGEPPESVKKTADELRAIRAERKAVKAKVAEELGTEHFLIVVFGSQKEKRQMLQRLGLPEDERYIPSGSVRIEITRRATIKGAKSAPPRKASGG